MCFRKKKLPEFYRNITFTLINGDKKTGYLEPGFSFDDDPWFSTEDYLLFSPKDVKTWHYI